MSNGNEPVYNEHFGLTKRELIAAMAMQGYLASGAIIDGAYLPAIIAEKSVMYADALLEDLNGES